MRHLIVMATVVFLIAAAGHGVAAPFAPAGFSRAERAPVIQIQANERRNIDAEGQARLAQHRRLQVRCELSDQ